MKNIFAILIGATIITISTASYARAGDLCSQPADTAEGKVTGFAAKHAASCSYLGIPYAAPPVGELRFRSPQPAPNRSETLQASKFGSVCPQKPASDLAGGTDGSVNEDCLYLNIYRPAKEGAFPVMFWIHGGGNVQGAGSNIIYHGETLAAERDVVVVTMNYRIGALGSLALPELAAEDPNGSTGNYCMLDTVFALKWVSENIAGFGGDPNNITAFGQSQGSVSVCNLLATPLAKGLFHRAIMMSGGCDLAQPLEKSEEQGLALAAALGCEGDNIAACLRKIPTKKFLDVRLGDAGMTLMNTIDGYFLQDKPINMFEKGNFNRVPVMVGSNKDEMNILFIVPGATWLSKKSVTKLLRKALGDKTDEILELYNFEDYRKPIFLIGAIIADAFGARAFDAAEKLSEYTSVYMYRFDWDQEKFGKKLGAFHGMEIPFVFSNLDNLSALMRWFLSKKYHKEALALSDNMSAYWTNFAKTGNPNSSGMPDWPLYEKSSRKRLYFDNDITVSPIEYYQIKLYRYWVDFDPTELNAEF